MRIAVVGTGISGMLSAYLLCEEHDLVVYESAGRVGGHTHTVAVEVGGREYHVDTGFIVYNERTYPGFTSLLDWIGARSLPTSMSFSVKCERTGLEYNGTSLDTLFAQRRNLVRPSFWRMVRDIVRFYERGKAALARGETSRTLGEFLDGGDYGRLFLEQHLIPMASAIWSADPGVIRSMPLEFFLQFFANHGFLDVRDRPVWRVIRGGSSQYAGRLTRPYIERIRCNSPVEAVRRFPTHVEVRSRGATERYDAVIIAAHSDQALRMLADPSAEERAVLGAIEYQENDVTLHTDDSILPRSRRARAAWNYHVLDEPPSRAVVTYDINVLQSIRAPVTFCVTLNRREAIRPERVLRQLTYHHPVFTARAIEAQGRWHEINGVKRTWFCGAYWGYGFHEDGVQSAIRVARALGKDFEPCRAASTRAAYATGGAAP